MKALALAAGLMLGSTPAEAACRLALAVGLDVSGSVNAAEYALQRTGLAAALGHPDVTSALFAQPDLHVRIAVYEWSGPSHQQVVIDWTAITDRTVLDRVIAQLARIDPGEDSTRRRDLSTALGTAMQTGAGLLDQQRQCWRRKLDLSGDGKQNTGPHPRDMRAVLQDRGITINALAIGTDNPAAGDIRMVEISELVSYFKTWVIMGPDAFVETALGFPDFEAAMVRKLRREMESPVLSWTDGTGPGVPMTRLPQ